MAGLRQRFPAKGGKLLNWSPKAEADSTIRPSLEKRVQVHTLDWGAEKQRQS